MSASILLLECLEEIFFFLLENISGDIYTYTSVKYLRPCTLVSRHWCKVSTPLLYAYPFHHLVYCDSHISNIFRLTRTLLNCIPKSEIEQIITSNSSNIKKFFSRSVKKSSSSSSSPLPSSSLSSSSSSSSSNILATFNYITFIRGLIFNETFTDSYKLFYYRKIWAPSYVPKHTKHNITTRKSKLVINHFIKFLCKNCNNLQALEFPFTVQDDEFFNNAIKLLTLKDSDGKNKLSNLKELHYISRYEDILTPKNLYLALSNGIICNNLRLINNEGIQSIEKANSLSKFISLQKNLKHITLSERFTRSNLDNNYNIVFISLSSQSDNLQKLDFISLSFNTISEKALKSLCLLTNVRELKLYECRGINDDLIPWAESLTNLEIFEFVVDDYTIISENFLIKLIQSSSITLIKLIINYGRLKEQNCQLFKEISIHLKSLIHLELPKIFPNELTSIFKSCKKLVCFSATLSSNYELWEESFKFLGKFIPKNLQKIQLKDIDHYLFSSIGSNSVNSGRIGGNNNNKYDNISCGSIRYFFEDCYKNNRNLKYFEIKGKFVSNTSHFDVAKEFGIQLIKTRA